MSLANYIKVRWNASRGYFDIQADPANPIPVSLVGADLTGLEISLEHISATIEGPLGAQVVAGSVAVALATDGVVGARTDNAAQTGTVSEMALMKWITQRANLPRTSRVTPTVSTSPAYAAGDVYGGLLTFASALPFSTAGGFLESLVVIDKGNIKPEFSLLIFKDTPTATANDNAALTLASGDEAKYLKRVDIIASDYKQVAGWSIAAPSFAPFPVESSGTSLWGFAVADGTPTLTSTTELTFILGLI